MSEYSRVGVRMKEYIQPFEERLALHELRSLTGGEPTRISDSATSGQDYEVRTRIPDETLRRRLTYWETLTRDGDDESVPTKQVRLEATSKSNGSGKLCPADQQSLDDQFQRPNRRILRYGPHGLHDYRGKFFPQLVKALLNHAQLTDDAVVLDPMCGSGTTIVEARLLGYDCIGLDVNPLSLLISRAKSSSLELEPDHLLSQYAAFQQQVLSLKPSKSREWLSDLPQRDQEYLDSWFPSGVLDQLDPVMVAISDYEDRRYRLLFAVAVSNILRKVSHQKEDDLRTRRADEHDPDVDARQELARELARAARNLAPFLEEIDSAQLGKSLITEHDARKLDEASGPIGTGPGMVDAVVTSPPYASALPYLDTDRLSLSYLGLLPRDSHRSRNYDMIGNREINKSDWRAYWDAYQEQRNELPESVCQLIDHIYEANKDADVGFRRRNMPALLFKYFYDMTLVLQSLANILRKDGWAFVVIGNNRTKAGGEWVSIRSNDLLAEIGAREGFELEMRIGMEMVDTYDIFSGNAIETESILCFRRSG